MKSCVFERIRAFVRPRAPETRSYFCSEPWTGILGVGADGDVVCCPCYAKVKVGNVNQSSLQGIWNSKILVAMRKAFREGRLPRECEGQLCPVALDKGTQQVEERLSPVVGVDGQDNA